MLWLAYGVPYAAEATRVEAKDTDGDGRPDQWVTYEGPRPVKLERDRNGDGKPDVWATYTYPLPGAERLPAGRPVSERRGETTVDRDFNGTPDYWRTEQNGAPVREWGDLNGDGAVDHWTFYAKGRKQWAVMDKNGDGRPDAWFFYGEPGIQVPGMARPIAGEIDDDYDGKPDKTFGTLPTDRPTVEPSPQP